MCRLKVCTILCLLNSVSENVQVSFSIYIDLYCTRLNKDEQEEPISEWHPWTDSTVLVAILFDLFISVQIVERGVLLAFCIPFVNVIDYKKPIRC